MKLLRKFIVWLVILSMIMTNTAFANLSEGFVEKADESKIVEQLKEDLGEEKAEEILNASALQENEVEEIKEDNVIIADKEENGIGEEDLSKNDIEEVEEDVEEPEEDVEEPEEDVEEPEEDVEEPEENAEELEEAAEELEENVEEESEETDDTSVDLADEEEKESEETDGDLVDIDVNETNDEKPEVNEVDEETVGEEKDELESSYEEESDETLEQEKDIGVEENTTEENDETDTLDIEKEEENNNEIIENSVDENEESAIEEKETVSTDVNENKETDSSEVINEENTKTVKEQNLIDENTKEKNEEKIEEKIEENRTNESNEKESIAEENNVADLEISQSANEEVKEDLETIANQEVQLLEQNKLNLFGSTPTANIYWWLTGTSPNQTLHLSSAVPAVAHNDNYSATALDDTQKAGVETIKIEDTVVLPEDCLSFFDGYKNLTSFQNLDKLDTSNVTRMRFMFQHCENITSIDLTNFNTENVTDMAAMFEYCKKLTEIKGINSLDTSSVTQMSEMFYGCEKLEYLDISNLNTSNVEYMDGMFSNCMKLKILHLEGMDTSSVKTMSGMFEMCPSLEKIYRFDAFDTTSFSSPYAGDYMFNLCIKINGNGITTYDASKTNEEYARPATATEPGYFSYPTWEVVFNSMGGSPVATASVVKGTAATRPDNPVKDGYAIVDWYTEEECTNVYDFTTPVTADMTLYAKWEESIKWWLSDGDTVLHLSNAVPSVATFNEKFDMFSVADKTGITKIIIEDNVVLPEISANLFANFTNLISIQDIDKLNTSNVENMYGMFSNNANLISLDLSNFDTSNVTDMQQMFMGCMALNSLTLTGFDTSKVTNMSTMFGACVMLPSLDLSSFDTSLVTMMADMFGDCASLTSVDISGFNTHNVDNMGGMFWGCASLERIYYDGAFDTTSLTYSDDMFTDCNAINGNGITVYDDSKVDVTYARSAYIDASGNTVNGYFTSSFTVTFNSMGGSSVAPLTVYGGTAVTRPEDPTKDGYAIVDWYTEEECTNVYDFSTPVTADMTLYAKWEKSIKWWLSDGDTVLHLSNAVPSGVTYYEKFPSTITPAQKSGVQKIKIEDTILAPESCSHFFSGYSNLTEIQDLNKFDTSNVTSMFYMFSETGKGTLDISGLNTENVTNMTCMFESCSELTQIIGLDGFDTSNVTNMNGMFFHCDKITSIDLSSFDMSNVTTMEEMFMHCMLLENVYFADDIDTSNLTSMREMFAFCFALTELDLTKFDTSNVTDMSGTFFACITLTELDLTSFDTSSVEEMQEMFYGCENLERIYYNGAFDTTSLTRSEDMFDSCENINGNDITTYDSSHTDATYAREATATAPGYFTPLFKTVTFNSMGGSTVEAVTVPKGSVVARPEDPTKDGYNFVDWYKEETYANVYDFDTPVTENITLYAKWEELLVQWTVTFNTMGGSVIAPVIVNDGEKVTRPADPTKDGYAIVDWYTEEECTNVYDFSTPVTADMTLYAKWEESIKWWLSDGDTVLHLSNAVPAVAHNDNYNATALDSTQKAGVETIKIEDTVVLPEDCSQFFKDYGNLTSFQDLDKLDTSNVKNMSEMFRNCSKLISIDISSFNTSLLENMYYMFGYCVVLENIYLGNIDTSKVETMAGLFYECHKLATIDLSNFDTSNVTDMTNMFASCYILENINLANFNTTNVTSMRLMFSFCFALTELDLTKFDTSNVTDMSGTFFGCLALTELDLTSFDTSSVEEMQDMFYGCENLERIYYNGAFDTTSLTRSEDMFDSCENINGNDITTYDSSHTDATYAREATATAPGYFTPLFKTVTFNSMGGSSIAPVIVNDGEKATRPEDPTKDGYNFVDWYKEETYANVYDFDTPVTANITLYAKWEELPVQWTVTFNTMGGSVIAPVIVNDGQKVVKPSNPSRNNKSFVGWYEEQSCKYRYDFDTPVTANITLYAGWKTISNTSSSGGGSGKDGYSYINGPLLQTKELRKQQTETKYVTKITDLYVRNINAETTGFVWEKQTQGTWKMRTNNLNSVYYVSSFVNVLDLPKTSQYLSTYYFNENGVMQTGWIQNLDNSWCYMELEKTANEGRMVCGWKEISHKWYYFSNEGKLLTNTVTPDGFIVNVNGEWVK